MIKFKSQTLPRDRDRSLITYNLRIRLQRLTYVLTLSNDTTVQVKIESSWTVASFNVKSYLSMRCRKKNCGSYFVNKITEVGKQRQESSMTCDYTNQKEYLPSKTKEGKKKQLKNRRQIAYENVWQMLIIWELKRKEKCVQEFQWVDLVDPNGSCQTREQIYFCHIKRKRYINLKIAVWMWVINDLHIWFIRGFWVCWTSFHSLAVLTEMEKQHISLHKRTFTWRSVFVPFPSFEVENVDSVNKSWNSTFAFERHFVMLLFNFLLLLSRNLETSLLTSTHIPHSVE